MQRLNISKGEIKATVTSSGAWVLELKKGDKDICMPGFEYEKDGLIKKRGGIPILFPNAGKEVLSSSFTLKQHGFARDMEWEVYQIEKSNLTLKLVSNKQFYEDFPYKFEALARFSVLENGFSIDLKVTNLSNEILPIAPGFHPYFNLPVDKREQLKLKLGGFNKEKFQFDGKTTYLISTGSTVVSLPDIGKIEMLYSDNLRNVSIWAEPDGNHICVEPWVGGEGAMLDPAKRVNVPVNSVANFQLSLEF